MRLRCAAYDEAEDIYSLGILQPSINEMLKGESKIIKWKVKIHELVKWVGIGIGMKSFLEKNNFTFSNHYYIENHGVWIISNNELILAHKDKEYNSKKEGAFKLIKGDVVNLTLDMEKRLINFNVKRLNRSMEVRLPSKTENGDEFCILLILYQEGDEAEVFDIDLGVEKKVELKKELK